jgi:hypothetical protein
MKAILILFCGMTAISSEMPVAVAPATVELEFLLPEEVIKDHLARGDELALIRVNSVKEENPGTKSHLTTYKATILKSIPEKKSGWSWLGLRRKETFWDWGPPMLAKADYMTTFGEPGEKNWNSIDGIRSTVRVPESRGVEIFEAHRRIREQILARADILPDSVLKAAAMGKIEIAVLQIANAKPEVDSISQDTLATTHDATALRWLAGKEKEEVTLRVKGVSSLKWRRDYLFAFSSTSKESQPLISIELFPGNMDRTIRMHQEKIRSFGKNADAGEP